MYISTDRKTTVPDDEATAYMLEHTTEEERLQELTEWFFSGEWSYYETCARCGNAGNDFINNLCTDCRKGILKEDYINGK